MIFSRVRWRSILSYQSCGLSDSRYRRCKTYTLIILDIEKNSSRRILLVEVSQDRALLGRQSIVNRRFITCVPVPIVVHGKWRIQPMSFEIRQCVRKQAGGGYQKSPGVVS